MDETSEQVETSPLDTRHEPHPHARPRLIWGIAALALVLAGVALWSLRGSELREQCADDLTGCTVAPGDVPEGGATFDRPAFP